MPIVTVNPGEYTKVDLKTAPPDGFVEIRPLPYGMKLTRRSKSTKMMMRAQQPTRGKKAENPENVFELDNQDEWAVAFDFAYCIGTHNLQNADGTLIDFTNPMSLKALDPKVGSEIERAIDSLNNDDDEESLEDFLRQSGTSSEDERTMSKPDGSEQ